MYNHKKKNQYKLKKTTKNNKIVAKFTYISSYFKWYIRQEKKNSIAFIEYLFIDLIINYTGINFKTKDRYI